MESSGTAGEADDLSVFTAKQRRVLDLLIENKTSKEIARTLGISPYTVDQRISLARSKLGVSTRNELAAQYRAMRLGRAAEGTAEQEGDSPGVRSEDAEALTRINPQQQGSISSGAKEISFPTAYKVDYRVGPKVFQGRHAGLWRLGAIVATALLLVITILGLFAIFEQLSDMLT